METPLAAKTLAIALEAYHPALASRTSQTQEVTIRQTEKGTDVSTAWRNLGRWQVPAGEEDDGDYDWCEQHPEDAATTFQHFAQWVAANTPQDHTAAPRIDGSEKNWLNFTILLTKKVA